MVPPLLMGLLPWTTARRRIAMLMGCTMTALALLLPAAQESSASDVARVATRLAAETQQLATARDDLDTTRDALRDVRGDHRRLRAEVEGRLVAIYKHGNAAGALERVAGGESMSDVGYSLDALEHVARHDSRVLRRWKQLDRRRAKLLQRRARLTAKVRRLEKSVRRARQQLSRAEAAAARARRDAEDMATIQDSPLLPKVGHPENTSVEATTGGSTSSVAQPIGFTQSGVASMYDDSFSGEMTANGEHYDPNAFTAAHPSLPFGTWVTVSGPGGSVAVRINDRGPFVGGRIIDLSRAAAGAIGLSLGQVSLSVAA
ncbi:MAG: septal ring lytic transglycosylase RlpA family lipoprotein [Thermoleophilia bacterium]|nr:septal ring lytic transglycosylase RlpA family lipoprotein [Thermoleophilia bacterium]